MMLVVSKLISSHIGLTNTILIIVFYSLVLSLVISQFFERVASVAALILCDKVSTSHTKTYILGLEASFGGDNEKKKFL